MKPLITKLGSFPLHLLHFPPQSITSPVIIISTATGVPAKYYTDFATRINSLGGGVILFDYRYCGNSFPGGIDARIKEERLAALRGGAVTTIAGCWKADFESALLHARALYPKNELVSIGHSVGGHLLQIIDPKILQQVNLSRALWLGVVNPYINYLPSFYSKRMQIYNFMLTKTKELSYFPSSLIGQGHDIPSAAGLQWFKWSLSPIYMADQQLSFPHKIPILSIAFSDDSLAHSSPVITDDILECNRFPATRVYFDVEKMGWGEVGHVGAFLAKHGEKGGLWEKILLPYVLEGKIVKEGGEVREFRGGAVENREKL